MTQERRESGIVEKGTKDFYWGILPREEMRRFIEAARESGFERASRTFAFSGRFDYAEEYDRADFHFFLPLKASADVLDLGSGFGNITIPLSYYHNTITAADASRELLELIEIRARELQRGNISFVRIDPLGSGALPFPDQSFDAVILNGVWEWVGLSDITRDPADIQKDVLDEVFRILRPGGIVYIGIENRWFPGWLGRDPHSKLRYTTVMPRWIAHWYSRRHGLADGYRTYIHGYRAFKKKFLSSGFSLLQLLVPYTSYRDSQYIYPHDPNVSQFLFTQGYGARIYTGRWYTLLRLLYLIGAHHLFLSSFMFILRKPDGEDIASRVAETVLKQTQEWHSGDSVMKIKSDDPDRVSLAAFHAGENMPYGVYEICRIPDASQDQIPRFRSWKE